MYKFSNFLNNCKYWIAFFPLCFIRTLFSEALRHLLTIEIQPPFCDKANGNVYYVLTYLCIIYLLADLLAFYLNIIVKKTSVVGNHEAQQMDMHYFPKKSYTKIKLTTVMGKG